MEAAKEDTHSEENKQNTLTDKTNPEEKNARNTEISSNFIQKLKTHIGIVTASIVKLDKLLGS